MQVSKHVLTKSSAFVFEYLHLTCILLCFQQCAEKWRWATIAYQARVVYLL